MFNFLLCFVCQSFALFSSFGQQLRYALSVRRKKQLAS